MGGVRDKLSFGDAECARRRTRREEFLGEIDRVDPWSQLESLIELHYPKAGGGSRPYALATMLGIHLMPNWFGSSDPAMEGALYEITPLLQFTRLRVAAIPDETTLLNFRHLLEMRDLGAKVVDVLNIDLGRKGLLLRRGRIVDATIIPAPSSTKNAGGERDPEMHQPA